LCTDCRATRQRVSEPEVVGEVSVGPPRAGLEARTDGDQRSATLY
jgi:hypothetical protein